MNKLRCWSLSMEGALSPFHCDRAGYCTFVQAVEGKKVWLWCENNMSSRNRIATRSCLYSTARLWPLFVVLFITDVVMIIISATNKIHYAQYGHHHQHLNHDHHYVEIFAFAQLLESGTHLDRMD